MSTQSHRIFLLRAYGDTTIALHFLANSHEKNNYTVIASSHLRPLIKALSSYIDLSFLKIEFVEFDITKSQLNLFTNRHLISTNTLHQVNKLSCDFVMLKSTNSILSELKSMYLPNALIKGFKWLEAMTS